MKIRMLIDISAVIRARTFDESAAYSRVTTVDVDLKNLPEDVVEAISALGVASNAHQGITLTKKAFSTLLKDYDTLDVVSIQDMEHMEEQIPGDTFPVFQIADPSNFVSEFQEYLGQFHTSMDAKFEKFLGKIRKERKSVRRWAAIVDGTLYVYDEEDALPEHVDAVVPFDHYVLDNPFPSYDEVYQSCQAFREHPKVIEFEAFKAETERNNKENFYNAEMAAVAKVERNSSEREAILERMDEVISLRVERNELSPLDVSAEVSSVVVPRLGLGLLSEREVPGSNMLPAADVLDIKLINDRLYQPFAVLRNEIEKALAKHNCTFSLVQTARQSRHSGGEQAYLKVCWKQGGFDIVGYKLVTAAERERRTA